MGQNGTQQELQARDWLVILVISLGTFMTGIDGSIVNIALPAIAQSLDVSTVTASWVLNAFLIIMISLLIMASRYGDMKGYRPVFLAGIVLFTLGSALCGLAPDIAFLILSRMLQGVGAAVISALGAAMIISYLPQSVRGQALGVVAMFLMLGVALGPVIGGYLTSAYSWRFIFYVNLPIGVALVLLGIHALPRLPPVSPGISLDMPGSVLLFLALSTLIIGLTSVQGRGGRTGMAALAASAAFWALFYVWERRTPSPLVNLSLFACRAYTFQSIGILLSQIPISGVMVLMPFYLELVRHIPTDHAGAILLGLPAGMILTAPLAGRISDRIGTKRPIIAGFAICAAALVLLSAVSPDTGIGYIVACLILLGAGTGTVFAPLNSAVMGESPVTEWGMTSGFVRMMTNLGISLGVALMMLVATAALGPELADASVSSLSPARLSGAFTITILFFVLPMVLGVLLMLPVKEKGPSGEGAGEPASGL
jgi:EmrB/QacA subfamily drug resistance transporter